MQKIDIFGLGPKLYIDNSTTYQTKFGGILTILLCGCIVIATWVYGKDIYYKENPQITLTEGYTTQPEKFELNKDTFAYVIGLQSQSLKAYIDPSIYTITTNLKTMAQVEQEDGNVITEFRSKNLKLKQCEDSDFHINRDYLRSQTDIYNYHCIDPNEIEGTYGSKTFSYLETNVVRCDNSTQIENNTGIICKTPQEIDEAMKGNFYSIFVSDQIINQKNFSEPFESIGRNFFGLLSQELYKHVEYYFRNVYIEDDTGIIFESKNERQSLQFMDEQTIITSTKENQNPNEMLRLIIRLDKYKYTKVYRIYLNLAEVLAKLGGIIKALMIIMLIVSITINKNLYNEHISNQIFNFDYDTVDKKKKMQNLKNNIKKNQKKNLKYNSLHEILLVSFFPCLTRNNRKKQMMDYAVDKISNHLNVTNILHKLQELEKLKILLLNQEQRTLFEFIPKPEIKESLVNINKSKNQKQREEKIKSLTMDDVDGKNNILQNLFIKDIRSEDQKLQETLKSIQVLNGQQKKKPLDIKLLSFIDKNELNSQYSQFLKKKILQNQNNQGQIDKKVLEEYQQVIDLINDKGHQQQKNQEAKLADSQIMYKMVKDNKDNRNTSGYYQNGEMSGMNNSQINLNFSYKNSGILKQQSQQQQQQEQQEQSQLQQQQLTTENEKNINILNTNIAKSNFMKSKKDLNSQLQEFDYVEDSNSCNFYEMVDYDQSEQYNVQFPKSPNFQQKDFKIKQPQEQILNDKKKIQQDIENNFQKSVSIDMDDNQQEEKQQQQQQL